MSDKISENREPESPFQREAAEKVNIELGNIKGILSSDETGIPILNKYEESELNRENSFKDPMTGLLNRRGVLEEYKLEQSTRKRLGASQGIALIGLDFIGLKKLNMELTPEVADETLKEGALSLQQQIRKIDLAARWGGDEFLLVLFGADETAAKNIIQKIQDHLPLRVHYNIGYRIVDPKNDPEIMMGGLMKQMEDVKHLGVVDETGRAQGNGVVVNVDNI
jgi:diguanylate cyclase (GGDEF)-like protein